MAQDPYQTPIQENHSRDTGMRCPCSRKRDFSRELIEKLRQCRSFLDSNSKLVCNLQGCAYWSGYQVKPTVVFFVRFCIKNENCSDTYFTDSSICLLTSIVLSDLLTSTLIWLWSLLSLEYSKICVKQTQLHENWTIVSTLIVDGMKVHLVLFKMICKGIP